MIAITFAEAIAGQSCAPAATRSLEEQLAATEILLIDLGASSEELAGALGPDGYARRMLREDRDAQIREVARWLAGGTLH